MKIEDKGETMEKYRCSRCRVLVPDVDIDVYHFKSIKPHTLLSIQMCLECRDVVFEFIEKNYILPSRCKDGGCE